MLSEGREDSEDKSVNKDSTGLMPQGAGKNFELDACASCKRGKTELGTLRVRS